MLLQAFGWFWCKKYRVSINETGGGRRIVLWANRICNTCRNYYTYIFYLLSLFSTFSFLKVSFEKTITFSWFFPILKPKYYIQNLPLSKTQFSHCALGENSNINFVGRCFSHLVGHIAIVIFFSAKLRFFKQMVMLDFDDGSKYITKIFFFSVFTKKQSKLHSCCHFLFLLPQVILNLFCFFVNSFRFTLHFYVTKAKVSNKPVIWHFFRQNKLQCTTTIHIQLHFTFHKTT